MAGKGAKEGQVLNTKHQDPSIRKTPSSNKCPDLVLVVVLVLVLGPFAGGISSMKTSTIGKDNCR